MKSIIFALASLCLFASIESAQANRPLPTKCHSNKQCKGSVCVRQNEDDKFGTCCQPLTCEELNVECGTTDNGCGVPLECPTCAPDSECIDNQCVLIPATTTTTDSTTTTTLNNPCIPNPCTTCGIFGFFWCNAYDDNSYQCVYNQGSGGSCGSDADCESGWRCAYNSTYGYRLCSDVTGVCAEDPANTTTTSSTTTTTAPFNPCDPNPCTECGVHESFWCEGYLDDTYECAWNTSVQNSNCTSDAECQEGWRCAAQGNLGDRHCVDVTGACPTTTTTTTSTTTTTLPCPAFVCGGAQNHCNDNVNCLLFQTPTESCNGTCGVVDICGSSCSSDADCGEGYFCAVSCCGTPTCTAVCPQP